LIQALLKEFLQQKATEKPPTVEQFIAQAESTISTTPSEDAKQLLKQTVERIKTELNNPNNKSSVVRDFQFLQLYLTDMTSPV
jgi:hypothetical protein